ncbi:MAG: ATP phosphoribosyltransferase regulatory subunit [Gammaproteobacteria bacterium]|nr:ATP phosphoribosyltransferase regulatory subunit [Gammaproteobacteria bacterium]MBT6586621.1 ATP phosphoribosyltransferase regulatory subunit [Gammaproteobacteria bacterium]
MGIVDRWLLPDGVEDILPLQAKRLEEVRRRLLDLFSTWGYDYVIPPMIEYLESLLTGTGRDLDLKTFKVIDFLTGRTMGVRADITPQVARIDAHSLNSDGVARLCYAGTVVQAQADSMLANRTPLSVGAELFGDSTSKADTEIVSLMIESLKSLGFDAVHVDLGNVDIFRQLMSGFALNTDQQELLFEAVQRKSVAEIGEHCDAFGLSEGDSFLLTQLPGLTGSNTVLEQARSLFKAHEGVLASIDSLQQVSDTIARRFTDLDVYFDLSELRGYAYHTGIVFAAYVNGSRSVVAKGGRYDHIGQVFGREARGATGFSIDVRSLTEKVRLPEESRKSVWVPEVPSGEEDSLWQRIKQLRTEGYVVVESGQPDDFSHHLDFQNGQWHLVSGDK